MTSLAEALAVRPLSAFEGHEVLRSTIAVTNAGDGLSEAMKFEPVELHHGQTVFVVLECEVAKVRFDPIKDTDALARVHVLRAGTATMVDEDLVREHLDEQAERIVRAKESAAGIQRLTDYDGDDGPIDDEDEDE